MLDIRLEISCFIIIKTKEIHLFDVIPAVKVQIPALTNETEHPWVPYYSMSYLTLKSTNSCINK